MTSNDREENKKKRGRPSKGVLALSPATRSRHYRQRRQVASMQREGERQDFLRFVAEIVRRVASSRALPEIRPALEEYSYLLKEVRTTLNTYSGVVFGIDDINKMFDDVIREEQGKVFSNDT